MSAEATRHRRTRFRSSTSSERGEVAEVLDLAQHVYPTTTRPQVILSSTIDKAEERELHPAGLVGLGFALLCLGLHQCLCMPLDESPSYKSSASWILLSLMLCGAAAQFIAGVRGSPFARGFHGAHSVIWAATALLLRGQRRGSISVAASMLLMAVGLACGAGAVVLPVVRPLLATAGLGLLCLSRAAFQRPYEADAAAAADGYGGAMLVLASGLAFRAAWWARKRRLAHARVASVRRPS